MPWFRSLLWIGTIFLMVVLGMKMYRLLNAEVATVEVFEFANKEKAKEIVEKWKATGLLHTVESSIRIDYVFMVFYVLLMINCSNHQMNLEQNLVLNNLLRLNIPLAVGTGILDLAENLIMEHNIRSMNDYFPTALISLVKFIFAGWIVLVYAFAVIKGRVMR